MTATRLRIGATRGIRGAALALPLLAFSALAGDEGPKADPRLPSRWEKDEVVRAKVAETTETRISLAGAPGGGAQGTSGLSKIEATFVRRCLEAGDDGRLVRSLVKIESFRVEVAGHEDRCLEGALVETGPEGCTLVASPANPSRLARGWLRNRFGKDGRGFSGGLAETGATGEVGAGATWEAEPSAIAGGLSRGALPLPLPERKWKYTVADAAKGDRGTTLRIEFDERFDVSGEAESDAGKLRLEDGSFVRTHGSVAGTPGLWHRTGRMEVAAEREFATSARGMKMKLLGTATESEAWDAGGTRPEVPEATAGAPAPRRIGGEEPWTAGTTITENGRIRRSTVTTPIGTDGKAGAAIPGETVTSWRAEIHCAEADDDGDPRVLFVSIGEWSAETGDGAPPDQSLSDSVVRVAREGWRIVEGGAGATDAAKSWISARFPDGPREDDLLRAAATPAMLAAPRATWAIDPMDATAALAPRFGFPIDPWSLQGKGTLTSMSGAGDDAAAALEFEITGIVSCAPGCGGEGAGQLKGSLRVTGRASGPAARWTRAGTFEDRAEVTSNLPALMDGEELRRVEIVEERKVARTLLGAGAQEARKLTLAGLALLAKEDAAKAIVELTRATEADATYPRAWSSRARARLAQKDFAGAIADASKALALEPRFVDALTARSTARQKSGDLDGALADLTAWTQVAPRNARSWYFRGRAKAAKEDVEGALADYTAAIDLNPKYTDALSARAGLHFGRDEFDRAVEDYSEVIALRPKDAGALCDRANARSASRQYELALEDAEAAIALDAGSARAWFTSAIAKGGKGDVEGQVADCAKALEINPDYTAVRTYRAPALEDLGRWEDAADDWTQVLARNPKSLDALLGRSRAKGLAGDTAAALADCDAALAIDPKLARAYVQSGHVRLAAFDEEGAAKDWKRAAELDPKDVNPLFNLARAKFLPGVPAAPAVEALRAALALGRRKDYGHLSLRLARAHAGDEEASQKELAAWELTREGGTDAEEDWYLRLVAFLTGRIDEAALLATAAEAEGRTKAEHLCEAAWYAGALRAIRGETAEAVTLLDRCLATDVRSYTEYTEATRWRPALVLGAVTVGARTDAAPGARRLLGVDPKGPAAKAGLRDGDVVVSLDGTKLAGPELPRRLLTAKPGTTLRLTVQREGKTIEVDVTLRGVPSGGK